MTSKTLLRVLWGSFLGLMAYWAFRLHGHFPAFMDTLEYTFPEKWFNVECFRSGRLPLWDPYLDCGLPHLANFQAACFYPFFWIWNITGLTDWFFWLAILHGVLAAAGFTLWVRSLKVPEPFASLCGTAFGASALLTHYWGFPTHLASLAWVPWVFWAGWRLVERTDPWRWGALVLTGTFQLLAGYPFFTFYTWALLPVFLWIKSHPRPGQWAALVSAGGTVLALTAAQWLPFLDFLGYLHRTGLGEQTYSLKVQNLLTLFGPDLLGVAGTEGYKSIPAVFIFNNFYLGWIPLGLLVWSSFSPVARDRFWGSSALLFLFWTLGIHFPLWRILPAGLLDRLEPAKASFLFLFCAFTAVGLFLKEKSDSLPKKSLLRRSAWVLGALWMVDLLLVPGRVLHLVPDPYREAKVLQAAQEAKLWAGGGRMLSLRKASEYYSQDVAGLAGSMEATAQALLPNTNLVFGLPSARGHLSIQLDGQQNLGRYVERGFPFEGRVLDASGVKLLLLPEALPAFKYKVHEAAGSLVLTRNAGAMPLAWEVGRVKEFPDRRAVLEALLDPRAFLEDEVFLEKDPQGGSIRSSLPARGLKIRKASFFDRMDAWASRLHQGNTQVSRSRPSPCEASFEVIPAGKGSLFGRGGPRPEKPRLGGSFEPSETPAGRWLVFGESYAPGWRAWVNGEPKPIFRAYGSLMAVVVRGGEGGEVLFRYEPVAVRLGLFLSLVAWIALLFAYLPSLRKIFFPRSLSRG